MIGKETITCSEFILALSSIRRWGNTKVADYIIRHDYDLQDCLNFLELELTPDEIFGFEEGLKNARIELAKNAEQGVGFVSMFDTVFPRRLCEARTPVVFLYYKGNIDLINQEKKLAVVGKRETPDSVIPMGIVGLGNELVSQMVQRFDAIIVSGLANGCDTIAHKAALANNGKTIAILPSSPAKIYPKENIDLANEIVDKNGLLISEYSVLSEIRESNFVQRDRIQSMASDSIVVIYSNADGGAMHAVKRSKEDGKATFAITGNNLPFIDEYIDPNNQDDLLKIRYTLGGVVDLTTGKPIR